MSTALFTVVKFEICKAIGKCKISGYLGDLRSTSRETHPTHRSKTNDLILNLTPENVTQHSRIVATTHKGSSTPTKMSKIILSPVKFPPKTCYHNFSLAAYFWYRPLKNVILHLCLKSLCYLLNGSHQLPK